MEALNQTLHHYVVVGNVDGVKSLIQQKADPNYKPIGYSGHPLAIAITAPILNALLDAGANINYITEHGYSVLILAILREKVEATRVLIERGATLSFRDLTHATYDRPNRVIYEILFEHGVRLSMFDHMQGLRNDTFFMLQELEQLTLLRCRKCRAACAALVMRQTGCILVRDVRMMIAKMMWKTRIKRVW